MFIGRKRWIKQYRKQDDKIEIRCTCDCCKVEVTVVVVVVVQTMENLANVS